MSLEKKSGEELMKVDSGPVEHCSDGSLGSVDEIGSEDGLLAGSTFSKMCARLPEQCLR